MKQLYPIFLGMLISLSAYSQETAYSISFPNAVHHEALVHAEFTGLNAGSLELRMSRASPGRYALHEFAKNVYGVVATDEKGQRLTVDRPDPYTWRVNGHRGTVAIRYFLYADRGDGTYSQVDETHAHLNMPATFMYAPELAQERIEVTFHPREDLDWKIATQLRHLSGNTYEAPNLQYFMDSPAELSNHSVREFSLDSGGRSYTLQFALHHQGSEAELDQYMEQVMQVVKEEKKVFGELPPFDFGRYTFLACYMPQVSGDGMEHRNSTVLTSTRSLAEGGMQDNIGTVSHEFFHAWNVERLRPESLEPFDFKKANMSGALWFAEGFTSYYTELILCRAGIISPEDYVSGLAGTFNYVWNSPALHFFNPVEMSYQAPFVDAATSIDPVNRENTFISYYSYGSVLGLALDLALRQQHLTLDGYFRKLWDMFGSKEQPYSLEDLQEVLNRYAGKDFGDRFFQDFIFESGMPDYSSLLSGVGVKLIRDQESAWLGISTTPGPTGYPAIRGNTIMGSPAYEAGLERGDIILEINGIALGSDGNPAQALPEFKAGDSLKVRYSRRGKEGSAILVATTNPTYSFHMVESRGKTPTPDQLKAREAWLGSQ